MVKNKRVRVLIAGKVQGVFFRMETRLSADRIGVKGWVRNTRDGKVEAVFEADEIRVAEMINWCKTGALLSRVSGIDVTEEEWIGEFTSFEIHH
jgi:acylphosphatase